MNEKLIIPQVPVFVCCLHKSGSHLLWNILGLLGLERSEKMGPHITLATGEEERKKGKCVSTVHQVPSTKVLEACEKGEAKLILNIRDPRDMFLSTVDWFDWTKPPTTFDHVNKYREICKKYFNERHDDLIYSILEGSMPEGYFDKLHFRNQLEDIYWYMCYVKNIHVTKYETLMMEQLSNLPKYLDESLYEDSCMNRGYDVCWKAKKMESKTFNVGKVGRWKEIFDPYIYADFLKIYGDTMINMGYEL